MRLIALGVVALLALSGTNAAKAATDTDRCTAVVNNYTYRPSDKSFLPTLNFLNGQFQKSVVQNRTNPLAITPGKPISKNTEVIRVETSSMLCGKALLSRNGAKGSSLVTPKLSCTQVGCTESLPVELDTVDVGGTVSITSCGGGIQTTSNYQKTENGSYVMTGYKQEYVTHCDPM